MSEMMSTIFMLAQAAVFIAVIVIIIVQAVKRGRVRAEKARDNASGSPEHPGLGWFMEKLPVIGGIVGLAAGFIVTVKTMEGSGDSPGGGVLFFLLIIATCLAGIAVGKVVKEAWAFKVRGGTGKRVVWYSAALLLLCLFSFTVWSSVDGSVRKAMNIHAYTDLRNCRTALYEYFAEHQGFPTALEDAQCQHAAAVVISATKLTKDEYALVSYHQEGDQEYMVRSDSSDFFFRERNSGKEWQKKF